MRRVCIVRFAAFLVVVTTAGACGGDPPQDVGAIQVTGAVVAQPLLGESAALYFTVSNGGSEPDTVVAVEVPGVGSASIHRSDTEDGVMRMRPAGPLEVPAGGQVRLRPGGLHVMLEDLTDALVAGDTVVVTVRAARSGLLTVPAVVVPYADLLDVLDPEG